MAKQFTILLALSILIIGVSFAQDTETDSVVDSVPRFSYLDVGTSYVSDVVFMGRSDSTKSPYLSTNIDYYHKSGLFFGSSISYLTTSSQNRIDLLTGTAGYGLGIGKFLGQLSATTYIFNDEAYNVKSPITWDISADFGFNFDMINFNVTGITFLNSNNTDFFFGVELLKDHHEADDRLQFSTSISMNFGSQNYYEEHYVNKAKGHTKGHGSPHQTSFIHDANKFNLLNMEWGLSINYLLNDFTFSFFPRLSFPFNDTKVTDQGNTSEEIDDTFFWSAGVSYTFY